MSEAAPRLGYSIAGPGTVPRELTELAADAERLGYASVWSSELVTDPIPILGWIAHSTKRVDLGTAVLQMPSRSAVSTAVSAVTLDRLSGGRFRLGIGTSGPQVAEGWHGQSYDQAIPRTRDYVAVLRLALAGKPVAYQGQTLTLPLPGSDAQPKPLPAASPRSASIPVYLAGLGPRAVALAGEIADGLIAIHCPPAYISRCRDWVRSGGARAGRQLGDFDLAVMMLTHVNDDVELARDMVRPTLAIYLGGMGTSATNFYRRLAERLGYGAEARRSQRFFADGDISEAVAALPDDLVDAMSVCGPPDYVAARLAEYRDAGATTIITGSPAPSYPMRREQLEWLADAAALRPAGSR